MGRTKIGRMVTFRLGPELEAEVAAWRDAMDVRDKSGALREMLWVAVDERRKLSRLPAHESRALMQARLEAMEDD